MKAVRRTSTKPEVAVARALRELGVRFRENVRSLPGTPDLANVRRRFAVFVHGCFWHRHSRCRYATLPKTNTAFWVDKFEANRRRDKRKKVALEKRGFRVLILWECETRKPGLSRRLERALKETT